MNAPYETGIEALITVLNYNGYGIYKRALLYHIDECYTGLISFPDFLDDLDADHPIRILWSVLVVMYGDYGTSPRYGWLEAEHRDILIEIIKKLDDEGDEE